MDCHKKRVTDPTTRKTDRDDENGEDETTLGAQQV